ncbi:AhpC-TSA-domain-containing protein [Pluteus cervinus]|uniref:AhpC-TSA-domain-containing protein n=1 Tax=Pluteus cervinus TaxID=181527 RepID=A0ACD3AQ46_9AGAR|nr:AhpC-TSA-domain-containing protein [Pluteus cervinus]
MEVDAPEGEKEEGSGTKKRARKAPAKAADEEDASSSTPSLPELNIGDPLPSLILKNEKDEDIQVADLVDEQNGVILFLVPKADTPGCTSQACGFRDAYPDFTGVNFRVYCLSADAPTAQAKWQTKKNLPYPLISDPKRILISALGAGEGGKTKRSHFIFGPKKDESGGKLLDKKIPVKPLDSPKLALEFIKSL